MPPLVMPWLARNPSSVCTSTSKIALPIPRTSYFAVVIHAVLLRQGRLGGKSAPGSAFARYKKVQRPITAGPAPASRAGMELQSLHDPLLSHGLLGNTGLAAAGVFARRDDRGAAGRGSGGGRVPGGVPAGQCSQAAARRGRAERGIGAGLARRARRWWRGRS